MRAGPAPRYDPSGGRPQQPPPKGSSVVNSNLPPAFDRVASLLRHELAEVELAGIVSEYPGAGEPRPALRLRLGHRVWLDLADDGREWFVAGLYADQSGATPPEQRTREALAVPVDAEARVVADAVVASVWRWVDAVGPVEADAPFARSRPAAPPAIPTPAAFVPPAAVVPPAPVVAPGAWSAAQQPWAAPQGWAGAQADPAGGQAPPASAPYASSAPSAATGPSASPYGAASPSGATSPYGAAAPYASSAPAGPYPPYAPEKPRRRGLLIGGIVAAAVLVLGGVGAGVFAAVGTASSVVAEQGGGDGTAQGTTPDDDAVPDASVQDLAVGDCFSFAPGDESAAEVSEIDMRSCDDDHQNEVYLQPALTASTDYPGDDAVFAEAEELCYGSFEGFVGTPYEDSEVDFSYLTPTEQTWADGPQSVLCYAFIDGDTSPGSLEGYGY